MSRTPSYDEYVKHLVTGTTDADRNALMRVIGMVTLSDHRDAADAAKFVSLRQAAGETPADFVKRITLALLKEMAGVAE